MRFTAPLAFIAALCACSGPKPEVSEVRFHPGEGKDTYLVEARVRNRSGGEGEISLQAKLVDPARGLIYEHEEKLEMKSHGDYGVMVKVQAPSGQYRPELEAVYPPGR